MANERRRSPVVPKPALPGQDAARSLWFNCVPSRSGYGSNRHRPLAASPGPRAASAGAVFVVMAACLGAVAARAHVAPASGAASAGIEKQPATRRIGALAHARDVLADNEVAGRP